MQYKQRSCKQKIFAVRGLKINLLGLPAIVELKLATKLDAITDYDSLVYSKFPTVFQGLENLGEPYAIQLKKDATLHAVYSAHAEYSFTSLK